MKKLGMVIDMQKCVGCGACGIACKSENNTRTATAESSFNWADFTTKAAGRFPNVKAETLPVLCNHCDNAACVKVCPVTPKAMYKAKDGTTLHNDERCIGCRRCQKACPYSSQKLAEAEDGYSVISFNPRKTSPQPFWADTSTAGKGTSSGKQTADKAGATPPDHNKYRHADYGSVRPDGVTEKCMFCAHRVKDGLQPSCVDACPAKARTFGDLNSGSSEVSKLLKKHKGTRLKEEAGTSPNVYYVRSFGRQG